MNDCVFCKIVKGEIPSEKVKETENFVVFNDINPRAPIHLLIVPKEHFQDFRDLPEELWVEIRTLALALANEKILRGFRLVHNVGEAAAVSHMHVHFLGEVSVEREV